jgi:parvulin-like peptidyl-prolyl isomerase
MTAPLGILIEPDKIVSLLKKNIQFKEVYQQVLYENIIQQAAEARGVTVSSQEIQAECDRLRHEKRLENASDTMNWLADQMIAVEELEIGIRDRLLAEKLAEHLFNQEVEKFFAQNKIDFEQVLIYQIVVPYAKLAQEILYQIEEAEISFYEAAHLYDIDERRRYQCGYEGKLYRWNLKPAIAAVVFNSKKVGELIGPVTVDKQSHLLMVEQFMPAELTLEIYQSIRQRLFKQWLDGALNYLLHNS